VIVRQIDLEGVPPAPPDPEPVAPKPKPARRAGSNGIGGDRLQSAKAVPLDVILKFNKQKFAKCPFHTEKTASLHWFGENRWKCFGCGEQGDSIDLVMKMFNLPMKDAIEHLLHL